MNPATPFDQKPAVEVTKDRNGTDQVVLRNQRGASAKVSLFFSSLESNSSDYQILQIMMILTTLLVCRLAYMEARSYPGGLIAVRNYCLQALR